jgi:ADP-ribose pyrophosphatase YjhB (NUDIX family)
MKKGEDFVGVSISFMCHDGKGNYHLAKRSEKCRDEHHRWDMGGGGLELHDTVENTLKKEILEELCVEPISWEFLGYSDVHREHAGKKTHWVSLIFKVLVDRNEVRNGEPEKFEETGWFPLNNLPSPLFSQLPARLEEFKDRL